MLHEYSHGGHHDEDQCQNHSHEEHNHSNEEHNHSHEGHDHSHEGHDHSHEGHDHSHSSNIEGLLLHIIDDFLGNLGVIIAAAVIWLVRDPWRFYFDPGASIFFSLVIFYVVYRPTRKAYRVLLQGIPDKLDRDGIIKMIEAKDNVANASNMMIWQLDDKTYVGSVTVEIERMGDCISTINDIRKSLRKQDIICTIEISPYNMGTNMETYKRGEDSLRNDQNSEEQQDISMGGDTNVDPDMIDVQTSSGKIV